MHSISEELCYAVVCENCNHSNNSNFTDINTHNSIVDDMQLISSLHALASVQGGSEHNMALDVAIPNGPIIPPPPVVNPTFPVARRKRGKQTPPPADIDKYKSKVKSLSILAQNRYDAYVKEILHLGCGDECKVCRVANQRRTQQKAIPESQAVYSTTLYEKTSFDHFEIDKHKLCQGVGGFNVALATKDEASSYAHFSPALRKDSTSVAEGIRSYWFSY
jgi:hypothetical protein